MSISNLYFQNDGESLKGVFVHKVVESGRDDVTGEVVWAKTGRRFKLETCQDLQPDCFLWIEMKEDV
jgi:hypothetical protein